LKAAARQRLAAGQGELDLGLDVTAPGGPLPITSSRMGCLLDALSRGFEVLGLGRASGGDVVFRDPVLARIFEPASKLDSLRVLEEAGAAAASYRTVLTASPENPQSPVIESHNARRQDAGRILPAKAHINTEIRCRRRLKNDPVSAGGFRQRVQIQPSLTSGPSGLLSARRRLHCLAAKQVLTPVGRPPRARFPLCSLTTGHSASRLPARGLARTQSEQSRL
jgi:hypothetical protein